MVRHVLSCSTDANPDYAFFAPLTALMWREVCGWDSLFALVGPVDPRVVEGLGVVGATVFRACPVKGSAATAQLIRLFSWLHPSVSPEDYLGIHDVDAWPLDARAYTPSGCDIDILCPAWMGGEGQNFPMGFVGAPVRIWSLLIDHGAYDPEEAVFRLYADDPGIAERARFGDPGFNYDEHLLTRCLRNYPGFPGCARIVRRMGQLLADRIERSDWPDYPDIRGKIDAHLPRPGYRADNWRKIRPVLEQCLAPHWLRWADDYRSTWSNA